MDFNGFLITSLFMLDHTKFCVMDCLYFHGKLFELRALFFHPQIWGKYSATFYFLLSDAVSKLFENSVCVGYDDYCSSFLFFFSFGNSVDLCVGWRFLWRSENWGYSSVSFFHYWFSHHVSPRALTIVLCNIKLHFFSMFTIGDRLRAKLKGNRVTEGLSETLWSW